MNAWYTKCIAYHFSGQLNVPKFFIVIRGRRRVVVDVERRDSITTRVITGVKVTRFGVPMMGTYVNTGIGARVTISPAVPGAQYRIAAWELDDGTRRSARPTVLFVTTREASELH